MRHFAAAVLSLIILPAICLAAGPATLPTQTSDGVPYGDAQPIKGFNPPSLPTIGRVLGMPAAQWVGHRKVITRTQSSGEVEKIERRENVLFIDEMKPEFIVVEGDGRYTGFNVDQGRIAAFFTLVRLSGQSDRESVANAIRNAGKSLNPGITAYCGEQPSLLEVKFQAGPWFIASHALEPEVAAAIKSERVLVGMTEEEADAAMWRYAKTVSADAGSVKTVAYVIRGNSGDNTQLSANIANGRVLAVFK